MKSAVVFLALTILSCSSQAADEERFPNTAAESQLPKGNEGLAAKFHGDKDIASHPDVLFADNFEEGEFLARWDDRGAAKASPLSLVPAGGGVCGERCLQVEARLGVNNGEGPTKWFQPAPVVYVRFYCRFEANCDYIHHFVTLRANKGQTGGDKWSGFGGAGLKPEGDKRFSTALEPWATGANGPLPAAGICTATGTK